MTQPLGRELQEDRDLEPPELRTLLAITRTAALVHDRISRFLKRRGLTRPQYDVLRILRGAEPPGLPSRAIGERMVQRVPDVTRLIDRLEAGGRVRRGRSARDRRVVLVSITARARREIDALDGPLRRLAEEILGNISLAELARLDGLLDRVGAAPTPEEFDSRLPS